MESFSVTEVIDGDTFDVSPSWRWNGSSGSRIRVAGYDAPELSQPGGDAARRKLASLILGRSVELGTGHTVDRGRLVCDAYLDGRNLASYFAEYQ